MVSKPVHSPSRSRPLGGGKSAGSGKGQREGELGGRIGEDVRGVGGDDAALAAGVEVDVVVADREIADHPQPRSGGVEKLGADRDGRIGDDRLGALRQLGNPLGSRAEPSLADLAAGGDPIGAGRRDPAGDEGDRARSAHVRADSAVSMTPWASTRT